ncbi:MAG: hypothetical protein K2P87_16625 [Lachnospiraceae bacterium]|nr:hypothetical protein [Lachnospiraceae bacterium]
MAKRRLLGKETFENKDKSQRYYKVIVLEPLTSAQYERGKRGSGVADYFVDARTYQALPENYEDFPAADLEFEVVGGKPQLLGITLCADTQKTGK